ncbi:hypothetical protein J6W34_04750 [bacterium]|nr:hypothetical protein [bacterium]
MAKLTKDEFIKKYNEKLADNNELAVELMEDITDSIESDISELEEMKKKYDDLLNRYKERFMSSDEVVEEVKEETTEEVDEEEVIDVKEI